MPDRHAKISFIANGHIIQDMLITDHSISAERLHEMLKTGEAVKGQHVCVTTSDWKPIAEVVYCEAELDYEEFQLEDEYAIKQPKPKPKTFDIPRMALAGAIGEYINEPDMTTADIMNALEKWGSFDPQINVVEHHRGMSGFALLKDIRLMAAGLQSLMKVAYEAGKDGKELV